MTTIKEFIRCAVIAIVFSFFSLTVSGKTNFLLIKSVYFNKNISGISDSDYHEVHTTILMGKVQLPASVCEIGGSNTPAKIILRKTGRFYALSVPYSKKYVFKLPNETTVYLNSNSKLLIDPLKNYFELSGEGYFKFTKGSNTVTIGNNITVKADSGDCVNLTCYSDYDFEPELTATLIKGKSVRVHSPKESYELHGAFNQLEIAKGYTDSVTNQNVAEAVMWTKDTYRYDAIDPYLLIARVGRWYNIKDIEFLYFGARRNMSFAGNYKWSFKKTMSEFLQSSIDISYRIENERLIVGKYSPFR